jgi:DNA mismatch repair ATPase MutS
MLIYILCLLSFSPSSDVLFPATLRTLYAQLNHCVTAVGKRLLKTWLARPLYHPESIRERQDAVGGLRVSSALICLLLTFHY